MTEENLTEDTLFEFPCQFPIKVMGKTTAEFKSIVLDIVRNHVTDVSDEHIKIRNSGKGNFVSITITITATSKKQLDSIYLELNASKHVDMTL